MKKTFTRYAFIFLLGITIGRFWPMEMENNFIRDHVSSQDSALVRPQDKNVIKIEGQSIKWKVAPQKNEDSKNETSKPQMAVSETKDESLVEKKDYRVFIEEWDLEKEEFQRKVNNYWKESLPEKRIVSEKNLEDGSLLSNSESDDGSTIIQVKNPDGALVSSQIKMPDGQDITKVFLPNGDPRGLFVVGKNNRKMHVLYSDGGKKEEILYPSKSGDSFLIKYDQDGQISEQWRIGRDGRKFLIE